MDARHQVRNKMRRGKTRRILMREPFLPSRGLIGLSSFQRRLHIKIIFISTRLQELVKQEEEEDEAAEEEEET